MNAFISIESNAKNKWKWTNSTPSEKICTVCQKQWFLILSRYFVLCNRFCCQKSNMFLSHSDAVLNWSIFKGDKSLEMLEIRAEIHVTVLINGKDFLKIPHNIYSSSTKTNSKSISLTFRPIEIVMCRQNVPFSTVLIWHFRRKNFTT